MTETLKKRTWAYVQPPKAFEMAPCDCGNHETQWSEFVGHLWCPVCKKDFKPAHGGVFDGPIPTKLAYSLGLRFDRVNLATERIQRYNVAAARYEDEITGDPVED